MTASILKEFKQDIESFSLLPSDGGKFEFSIDGDLVFSKLQKGRFPEDGEIQPHIRNRLSR